MSSWTGAGSGVDSVSSWTGAGSGVDCRFESAVGGLGKMWPWVLSEGPEWVGELNTEGGRQVSMKTGQMLCLGLQPQVKNC